MASPEYQEPQPPPQGEEMEIRPQVLLLRPLRPFMDEPLSKKFHLLRPWEAEDPSQFLAAHADVIRVVLISGIPTLDSSTIEALHRLECVVATSVGLDHVDTEACRQRGIAVANAGALYAEDTADYAVGLLIDVLRRVSAADRYVRRGRWKVDGDFPLGSKLGGKRVGIIGLGNIGSEIAKRLTAFGCFISYNSRRKKASVPYAYFSSVVELASQSDVLILSCSLTSETKRIVNRDVLLALGRDGVLINVGRGELVVEEELVKFLKEGLIGGAGLDVFEKEPSVPAELVQMDNVVLSPHRAIFTCETFGGGLLPLVTANLEAFFSNKPLLTPVQL